MSTDEQLNRSTKFLTKKETRMVNNGVLKVFISYCTKDSEKIKPIILKYISSIKGVKTFLAEVNLKPSSEITPTIINRVKSADIFIVFYSKAAKESEYVQQEIGIAKGNNKIIIPILLDITKPKAMLIETNYVNLSNQSKEQAELKRLNSFIVDNVDRKQQNRKLLTLGAFTIGLVALLLGENKGTT